jgi:hypothetical protein
MITPKTTNHGEQTQERGCQQVGPTGGELYTTPKYFENRPAGANNSPENRSINENSQRTADTTFLHANAKMRWPLSTSLCNNDWRRLQQRLPIHVTEIIMFKWYW